MSIQNTTTFMGVVIDPKGPSNPMIIKALAEGHCLLDICKFIEVTGFKLNMVMFDYFWQVMVGNTRVHLHPGVFEWFGYEGEIKEQRKNFIRMLKNNNIEYKELTRKDPEIDHYPSIQQEIALLPSNVQHSKFLIMEPDNIKMAIMQLKTKNGHIIRQYYIDLEKLMKLYVEYTLCFNKRKAESEITSLEAAMSDMKLERQKQEQMMIRQEAVIQHIKNQNDHLITQNDNLITQNQQLISQNEDFQGEFDNIQGELAVVQDKLNTSIEDRVPKVKTLNRLEQFILIKKNKANERYQYYVICGQNVYVTTRIGLLKRRFERMEVILKLEYQPNTKNLFGRFKETQTQKGNVNVRMNDIELVSMTEEELIEEFIKLDEEKLNVE